MQGLVTFHQGHHRGFMQNSSGLLYDDKLPGSVQKCFLRGLDSLHEGHHRGSMHTDKLPWSIMGLKTSNNIDIMG